MAQMSSNNNKANNQSNFENETTLLKFCETNGFDISQIRIAPSKDADGKPTGKYYWFVVDTDNKALRDADGKLQFVGYITADTANAFADPETPEKDFGYAEAVKVNEATGEEQRIACILITKLITRGCGKKV